MLLTSKAPFLKTTAPVKKKRGNGTVPAFL
jgi:hypothetical protein